MTRAPVIVVGAGWSGAVVAHRLAESSMQVEVLEREHVVGGHSRVERLQGVMYEPNGPHLLHTDDPQVAMFLGQLGLARRPYRFQAMTEIDLGAELRLMSWPPQVNELESLPQWPKIKSELELLPDAPSGDDFETYATSLMGDTLYSLFVRDYTWKQWGREPSALSSSFAPKRIDLRRDGDRDLFRDRWQWFPARGVNGAIERLLDRIPVTCGGPVTLRDLESMSASAFVITAALDEFVELDPGSSTLEWRGIRSRSRYIPASHSGTATPTYVINRPHMRVPYTRTIETKHASGQWVDGTVVTEEYPGWPARHYPVADVAGLNAERNSTLQLLIRRALAPTPVFFCGRLAEYVYINQDEAIMRAWSCANDVMKAMYG